MARNIRKPAARKQGSTTPARPVLVMVATRKGAWLYRGDAARKTWRAEGPHFLGHIISHLVLDPRDGQTLLAAAKTGHLGPTIFRSTDLGRSWKEAAHPPAFPKVPEGQKGRVVNHTFWLTPGHASEPNAWYAGTSPQGLFRSEDGGVTWKPLVKGMEVVDGFDPTNIAVHDPHCVQLCPSNPDRLYQQNHCGIYRLDRPSKQWVRIGKKMPKRVGDIGFPMVVHPRDDNTAWVFPMDGMTVWPRTSPDGLPSAYVTRDAGKTWQRLDSGLPVGQAWWTVKRQAMTADAQNPVGLYFGTTSGELWMSRDEGHRWTSMARHLPEIYAVEAAEI